MDGLVPGLLELRTESENREYQNLVGGVVDGECRVSNPDDLGSQTHTGAVRGLGG
jgi:hypothetical protein